MLNNKRILIIRLSSIGDVLHATPVAKALKTACPSCRITWIVSKTAAGLLNGNPYIDEILIWSREDFEAAAKNRRFGQLRKLWLELKVFYRQKSFDIALDIHGLFLTGAILYASKTPRRIGMAKTRELNRFFMTEQAPDPESGHVIDRYLSVLRPLGIQAKDRTMTLLVSQENEKRAAQFFRQNGLDESKPIVMVNPKTSWRSKNWPPKHFAACLRLIDKTAQVILCGGPQDAPDADEIKKLAGRSAVNAAGRTSLPELAALLKKSAVLLTGDTGALHIAIALGTPTVSLWGPTSPQQYGPLAGNHKTLLSPHSCRGCHKTTCRSKATACMAAITPEAAAASINAILTSRHP